jgi:oxygen-independent coproporphyrinogen-3 oxidase
MGETPVSAIATLPLAPAAAAADDELYVGYSYSYPHKSAYGPLTPPVPLTPLWQAERRDAMFLYFHIPFCEMRCGFCNLFARAGGDRAATDAYLDALERQCQALADVTAGTRRIARLAVGGGTPTFLTACQLDRLFDLADRFFDASPRRIPTSVETSPKTALEDRLQILLQRGVERVSLGVQSFFDDETQVLGRPQSVREVHQSLERLRVFPTLNIDLIYGHATQTPATWIASLRTALRYKPEELYLYPLYVRPGTGLGRHGATRAQATRHLYRAARDLLLAEGYEQNSMRFFQLPRPAASSLPVYCCQTDAMLGLGCGARSYTARLHYSSPFAVEAASVHAILDRWVAQKDADFRQATWGCVVSDDDRRRRFAVQSLLTSAGLDQADFKRLFEEPALEAFPVFQSWLQNGLVEQQAGVLRLTPLGYERSDSLGPALYSEVNRARFARFTQQ